MNINLERTKQLINIFAELSEERQNKILEKAVVLQFEQNQEDIANKKNEKISDDELKERTSKQLKEVFELTEQLKNMNKEQLAALGILLNEITNGKFAREDEIQIIINSHNMTIEEYLNKYLPGADIPEAKRILNKVKKK